MIPGHEEDRSEEGLGAEDWRLRWVAGLGEPKGGSMATTGHRVSLDGGRAREGRAGSWGRSAHDRPPSAPAGTGQPTARELAKCGQSITVQRTASAKGSSDGDSGEVRRLIQQHEQTTSAVRLCRLRADQDSDRVASLACWQDAATHRTANA